MIKKNELDYVDIQKLEDDLSILKADIIKGFEGLIAGFKGLSENQYSYAFRLYITEQRLKDQSLLSRGEVADIPTGT